MVFGISFKEVKIALLFILFGIGTWLISDSTVDWVKAHLSINPFYLGIVLVIIFLALVKYGSVLQLANPFR